MTEANKALIQAIYEAFGRGDAPFIASKVRPEARWDFNAIACFLNFAKLLSGL